MVLVLMVVKQTVVMMMMMTQPERLILVLDYCPPIKLRPVLCPVARALIGT